MTERWRYMPWRTMIEPRGCLLSGTENWVYFHNTNFMHNGRPASFIRVFGWEKTFVRAAASGAAQGDDHAK